MTLKGRSCKDYSIRRIRKLGSPEVFAKKYYKDGIDEILYMDTVASLYGRNHLSEIIKRTVKNVFVPITVGGGIRSVKDAISLLKSGADKIAINTAAVKKPSLINEIVRELGINVAFYLLRQKIKIIFGKFILKMEGNNWYISSRLGFRNFR